MATSYGGSEVPEPAPFDVRTDPISRGSCQHGCYGVNADACCPVHGVVAFLAARIRAQAAVDEVIAEASADSVRDEAEAALGGRYKLGELIGTFGATPSSECDAEDPPVYMAPGGARVCRCVVCGRCGRHTGNSNQGHYWSWCKVTKTIRKFHFCCPGDCALEVSADSDTRGGER